MLQCSGQHQLKRMILADVGTWGQMLRNSESHMLPVIESASIGTASSSRIAVHCSWRRPAASIARLCECATAASSGEQISLQASSSTYFSVHDASVAGNTVGEMPTTPNCSEAYEA